MKRVVYQIFPLIQLFFLILAAACAQKSIVWTGKHADIATVERPKEDFKVNDYIVVSYSPYDRNKNAPILYKFALTKDGKQCGLVYLKKLIGFGYLLCHEYFIHEDVFIRKDSTFFRSASDRFATLSISRDKPGYQELKYEVITKLIGVRQLTYTHVADTGDSVKVILYAGGSWSPQFFSDSCSGITITLPNIVNTAGNQEIYLKNDGTWIFLSSEGLSKEDIPQTPLLVKDSVTVEIVPYEEIEKKPVPLWIPTPRYPERARKAGIQGNVVIIALLDFEGGVMKTRVIKSSGNGLLDLAALKCAIRAKFQPAVQRGRKVKVWVSIPIKFRLTG